MNSEQTAPNPYVLAIFTAILSGLFVVFGIYLTSTFQVSQLHISKSLDFKIASYASFLDKVTKGKTNAVSKIEHVGLIVGNASTDGEIQEVEDYIAELSSRIDTEFLVELNQEFNLLRASGRKTIKENVDDILSALILDTENIDISIYPFDVQAAYIMYTPNIEKLDYSGLHNDAKKIYDFISSMPRSKVSYIDNKVSDDTRFSIILTASLFENLISNIKKELTVE